jgi:tetratricopeptide (TPR) repeat protein
MIKYAVLIITVFYAICCFIPDYWNWGVMGEKSNNYIFVIISIIAIVLLFNNTICVNIQKVVQKHIIYPVFNRLTRTPKIIRILLWATIPTFILYLIKIEVHIFGDSQNMIGNMVNGNLILPIYNGICVILTFLAKLFKISSRNDAQTLMGMVSIIAGPVFLYYLYNALKLLIKSDIRRLWLFLICSISGIIVLFTGYIETYPLLTAWLAIYLFHLLKTKKISVIILLFLIGVFLHFWFIAFLPSLLYIINHHKKWVHNRIVFYISIFFILGIYVSGQLVVRDGIPLTIPLINGSNTGGYTLFSIVHFIDFFNELIITGPILPILGLIFVITRIFKKATFSHKQKLLLFAAVPTLLISFFIDPLMGAYRDWDLISLFTLPLILFAALIIDSLKRDRFLTHILIPILLITSLHTLGFIYLNKHEGVSVDKAINIALKDPHYQGDYHDGKRNKTFAAILKKTFGRNEEANEIATRRVNIANANYTDIIFLAESYFNAKDYENAQQSFSLIHDYNLLPPLSKCSYGISLSLTDRHYKAIEVLNSAITDTLFYDILLLMGNSFLAIQQTDSCIKYYDSALRYTPDSVITLNFMVTFLAQFQEYGLAIEYLHLLGNISANPQEIQQRLNELISKQKLLESSPSN